MRNRLVDQGVQLLKSNMKVYCTGIAFFLLLTMALIGQSIDDQIKFVVEDYLNTDSPGIAVIASQGQQVLYENAFGIRHISNEDRIEVEDLFRVGSVTKQFTAVAILRLAQEKKLHLDDLIAKYFSEVEVAEKITIRQLLQHTSGLGNQSDVSAYNNNELDLSAYPDNMIQPILTSSLKFLNGSDYSYSNLGYILLGDIIEQVSGMSYESYLKEIFFEPLGMNDSGFEYLDDGVDLKISGHSFLNDKYELAAKINMKLAYSAGGMVSSLRDLARWNHAVMSGDILPEQYINQIQTSNVLAEGKNTGYSLGWQIGNIQGSKTVKHDGIVNGFTSITLYVPESDLFVAVLSNCDGYRDIEVLASRITALLLNDPFASGQSKVSFDVLESFQGKFVHQDSEMSIALHDSTLMYYAPGGEKRRLIPIGPITLQIEGTLDQLTFNFDHNESQYTLMTLNQITHWERKTPLTAYRSLKLEKEDLAEYIGKYQVPNAFVFDVIMIDDKLYGKIGNDKKEIFCFEPDKFCAIQTDASLHFLRDEFGEIDKLTLNLDRAITAQRVN